jgi:hypothetical protein
VSMSPPWDRSVAYPTESISDADEDLDFTN